MENAAASLDEAVVAAMQRWFGDNWGNVRQPLTSDTAIERTYGISGDDIWDMLEWLEVDLRAELSTDFPATTHFGQERGSPWQQISEPLTPRVIARYLRPMPEKTYQVIMSIADWCRQNGVRSGPLVGPYHYIEDRLWIRGVRTQALLDHVCRQMQSTLGPDFDPRRHLRSTHILRWFARPPEPLTPSSLAGLLRDAG